ncbi:hypothetical protein [Fischerella sp. PCC 9605]|uniref:hypothetical protein n=1 Tax=Fischerella sp. PCC 9605 TaxID=1173024 RepID=UPI00047D6F65|nr:hypothetical protein [Fischerella sp. PCC 9605]
MRIFVTYDEQGNIMSVNTPHETMSENLKLMPGEGQFVAEIDPSQANALFLTNTERDNLANLAQSLIECFRIQQGKLVPKDNYQSIK